MFKYMIFFVLLIILTQATARNFPTFNDVTPMKTYREDEEVAKVSINANCSGPEEEDCLIKRSLATHIDYIYTQRNNNNK
ncbi:hypothetical protein DCAR_0208711 [Daucus carota subsp. sativus]|uniref:Phytosulfokine n=1 Tax=Daucus carota subsp. sativus TaxID=79200 RepID=A0AAF1ANQ0_DAUCS|nr:hypothetical protein DCAR_0208711 [Daucus carota subsp. sativus]